MTAAVTTRVALDERAYDIHIGPGLLDRAGALILPVLKGRRVFVVTDANVAPLYLDRLTAALTQAGVSSVAKVMPAGEGTKTFAHLEDLLDALLAAKCERGTTLVALGGGVIGDLTGFAASVLLRGVDFVQIPTTLLAQVDSSVGGKTGINTKRGKNLVGSFHQPRLVLADIDTLDTLPRRELLAGYAEVVKYGLIDDRRFFDWLVAEGPALLAGDRALRQRAVLRCCEAKARIVAADEKETGLRALLNLGHTFGHALEAESGFGAALLHGEAVAVGMVMAFDLSVRLGFCPADHAAQVRRHLAAVGLAVDPPPLPGVVWDVDALVAHMAGDKKVKDGRVTFVLAKIIGKAFLDREVPTEAVRAMLADAVKR